jgi:hypothetical protein
MVQKRRFEMKGRIFAVVFVVVAGLVVFLSGSRAQAPTAPGQAVTSLFEELNSGDLDAALALFSADAVARNKVGGETYTGAGEIREMLARMHKEDRRLNIVKLEEAGDQVLVTAEISDGGLVWGTEWITVGLKNGKIQSYELTAVRLKF